MGLFKRLYAWIFPDNRSDWEKKQERQFIEAINSLRNYSVTSRGGLSMDPEEVREQVLASREAYRHLIQNPSLDHPPKAQQSTCTPKPHGDHSHSHSPTEVLDYIEVVTWRCLPSGATVRYVCLQALPAAKYAIATADFFSDCGDGLPPWLETRINQRIAAALKDSEINWFDTASAAMDAFDKSL